ncbi:MAG: hypothetical protein IJR99_10215 [Kiritimatiellae bacterium]|nr:hypothetical protein [Kiritimatiellia bacterium]
MTPDENGIYRWRYSVNLYRNLGILWLLFKVFAWIFVGCVIFNLFLSDFHISLAGVKWFAIGFAGCMALVTASYYLYALIQGGRYTWDFAMDEEGVSATQAPNEAKKTKAIGIVAAAMGVATGNLSQVGVGMTVSSRDGMYSRFGTVSKVKADRNHNTINLRNGLYHNQLFVSEEDFDFVLNFITTHCPKLKK